MLVPEPSLLLGFRYAGHAYLGGERLPVATLTGLRSSPRRMRTTAGGGLVLAVLQAGGATRILSRPLHEYFEATVSQCHLYAPSETEQVSNEIASARSATDRVRIVEAFLLQRARRSHAADAVVCEALSRIRGRAGPVPIGELAKSLGLSRDRFEKRFRRAVGTTASHYASLVRFERARAWASRVPKLSELAQSSGYYDQSHLIRECRRLTGQSPRQFFGKAEFC